MFSSTYKIVMKTLMGMKHGQLTIYENNLVLTGFINILGHQNEIQDGTLINGKCKFSGEFVTPIRTILFTAEGFADEKAISLNVKAGLLDMYISGEIDNVFEKGG